jgi:hypothetical protein
MVGVVFHKNDARFDILMSNGNNGSLDFTTKHEIRITKQEPVAKIAVYQDDKWANLEGFRFYSKEEEVLLEVGRFV